MITMAPADTYGWSEMLRLSGASYRQFDLWRASGLFGPEHQGTGSGRADTGYTDTDVLVARAVHRIGQAFVGDRRGGAGERVRLRVADEVRSLRIRLSHPGIVTIDLDMFVTVSIDLRERLG